MAKQARSLLFVLIIVASILALIGCSRPPTQSVDISPSQQIDCPDQAGRTVQLKVHYYWSPRALNDRGFFGGPWRWFPPRNKKWIVVNFTVVNRTGVRKHISSYDIDLVCSDGQVYNAHSSVWSENDDRINDFIGATLIPGGYASGDLIYVVEAFANPVRLEYNG